MLSHPADRVGAVRGRYLRENFAQGGIGLVQIVPELITNADARRSPPAVVATAASSCALVPRTRRSSPPGARRCVDRSGLNDNHRQGALRGHRRSPAPDRRCRGAAHSRPSRPARPGAALRATACSKSRASPTPSTRGQRMRSSRATSARNVRAIPPSGSSATSPKETGSDFTVTTRGSAEQAVRGAGATGLEPATSGVTVDVRVSSCRSWGRLEPIKVPETSYFCLKRYSQRYSGRCATPGRLLRYCAPLWSAEHRVQERL